MEEHTTVVPQKKKDDTLQGLIIVGVILVLLLGFMYLFSIQKNAAECTPIYNPDGSIQTGCGEVNQVSPTPEGPVKLLDRLNSKESEVDKRLRESAEELQRKIQQQQQQQMQQQMPQQQVPNVPAGL